LFPARDIEYGEYNNVIYCVSVGSHSGRGGLALDGIGC